MSVQEIGALHSRYIDLSGRFKALWTFGQFLQGMRNLAPELDLDLRRTDLQTVYASLKELSQNLTTSASDRLTTQLEAIGRSLNQQTEVLVAADAKLTPSLVRQFFERVKNYDEKILTQMVRFYLYLQDAPRWHGDRLDKVDFLLTKLSEEVQPGSGQFAVRDRSHLREIFVSLWGQVGEASELEAGAAEQRAAVDALRRELGEVRDLEGLQSRSLIRRYRELKQTMGRQLFEPSLLLSIVETNIALKNAVKQYYRVEEQRIVSEYQQVFELETRVPVDMQLDQELTSFHHTVEQFERKQREENVKLDDVAHIRKQAQSLLPRLSGALPGGGEREPERNAEPTGVAEVERPALTPLRGSRLTSDDDLLGPYFKRLVDVLEGTDRDSSPKAVTLKREVYPLRLEPREVIAYRRLFATDASDRELEHFVVEGAALRMRINEEAEEITGLLDETAVTRDAPVFGRARQTARYADATVQRFAHYIDVAVQDSQFAEAQQLQLLRMRLIRDYSGLWLLVNRPQA